MADDAAPDGEPTASTSDEVDAVEASDDEAVTEPADEADDAVDAENEAPPKEPMSHVRLATLVGLALVVALAGLTGWLAFRAWESHQAQQRHDLFLEAGKRGAQNLTTIDFQQAEADVQRVLDSATGTFYDDFQSRAAPYTEVVKQAQSKSVGTINEAGVESETGDEARVLVAVTVQSSNAGAPQQDPRLWRMRLTVQKVGENDAKVSQVEFVP